MVTLNGIVIEPKYFSDGTLDISCVQNVSENSVINIRWNFEHNEEFFLIAYLTRHCQEHGTNNINLYMPYVPNARQDRVKNPTDILTMKYFAEMINALHFKRVHILDPHSDVCGALINNVYIQTAENFIYKVMSNYNPDNVVLFYPDEGAMKRYSDMIKHCFVYGIKHRDWQTREIKGMEIQTCGMDIAGKDILMIDDICSSGKTLLCAAQKLKTMGVNNIDLYVTHCENQIEYSPLLTSDIVRNIYTTSSHLTYRHPKIKIVAQI